MSACRRITSLGSLMALALCCGALLAAARPAAAFTTVNYDIAADTVWGTADAPVYITQDVTVNAGVTLTIQAGTELRVYDGKSLTVRGRLLCQGASGQHVLFHPDAAVPSAGQWKGIRFESTSTGNVLSYTTVDYAGGGGYLGAVVFADVSPANLRFDHCSIHYSASSGLYTSSSTGAADFTGGEITHCAGDGIYMGTNSTACNLSANTIRFNTGRAIAVGANKYAATGVLSDNGYNGIHLFSHVDVTTSGTYGVSFRCEGNLTVKTGTTLTLSPGVTYQSANNSTFAVQGTGQLVAEGTSDFPITVTPWSGRWRQLTFAQGTSGSLRYFILDQGGLGANEVLTFNEPAGLTIDNCEIKNCTTNTSYNPTAISGTSVGNVTITNNNIHDNGGYGIALHGPFPVNAGTGTSDALKNNRLVNNAKGAYGLDANIYPDPGTAQMSGNGYDGISLDADNYATVSGTYKMNVRFGTVWYGRTGLSIRSGATVTLLPGNEFRANWTDRFITVENGGALVAEGTAAQPITFGPTGDFMWRGIDFNYNSQGSLKYCIIDRAGSGRNIMLNFTQPASLTIDHCEIKGGALNNTSYYPTAIAGSSIGNVTLTNNNIHDNAGHGFDLIGSFPVNAGTGTSDFLANNTIMNCGRRAFVLDSGIYPEPGTAVVSGNGWGNLIVFNCYSGDVTIGGTYKYDVDIGNRDGYGGNYMNIKAGTTLTLPPGRRIFVWGNHGITVNGTLVADGTAGQPITFTGDATRGSWYGFNIGSTATATLRHCKIEYGGGSTPAISFTQGANLTVDNCDISNSTKSGIAGTSDGNVTVTNNNIHDNTEYGINVQGTWPVNGATGTSDKLKNNTIRNNGSYAFSLSPDIYPEPGTAVVSGNGVDAILFSCYGENIYTSGTYKYDIEVGNPPGYGGSQMTVKAGATLTLLPGRKVTVWNAHTIRVDGKLIAEGTAGEHILFTGQNRNRGDWGYLLFGSNSEGSLKYCDLEFGGRSSQPMLRMETPKSVLAENCTFLESVGPSVGGSIDTPGTASVTIRNCVLGKSDLRGVDLNVSNSGAFTLENSTVRDCTGHGIYLRGSSDSVNLVSNTISNNGGDAFNVDPDVYPSGCTLTGNAGFNGVVVDGAYTGNQASRTGTYETDVRLLAGLRVNAGKVVSLTPGKTVRVANGYGLSVYGELKSEGTSGSPITITSAAGTPARGDWVNLVVYSGGTATLKYTTVEYGRNGLLHCYAGGTLSCDQCIIRESSGHGMQTDGGHTLTNCQIYNNTQNGVLIGGSGGSITGSTIRNNGQAGVYVSSGTGSTLSQCAIYDNTGLAIDLDPTGVTANDTGDGDTGANNRQNYPVLTAAVVTTTNTVVSGTLDTQTGSATVDFFVNDALHSSGYGPGQTYLGSTTVAVASVASFTATLPKVAVGKFITATATLNGSTSEFSQGIESKPAFTFSAATYSAGEGAGAATITVNLSAAVNDTLTVDYATADSTARAGSDYTTASGTLTFAPMETTKTFGVPITNDTLDEDDETVQVSLSNPTKAGLAAPQNATLTITDDDDPPTVAFSAASYSVGEAGPSATATAQLSTASGKTVTVQYATSDGTGAAGSDYTTATGTLTFQPGETSATFAVTVTEDALDEEDETANLALSAPTNATLGGQSSAVVTITDNDDPPSASFTAATFGVDENAGNAGITVSLSAASGRVVTVNCATADGTAVAGSDYTAVTGSVTLQPGQTTGTLNVPVTNDTLDEEDETVTVSITGATNATSAAPTSAVLTIRDDDGPPQVAFTAASFVVDEPAGSVMVTAGLSAPSGKTVTVGYRTSDGTAAQTADYSAAAGTLTFAPGETSKSFTVAILDDTLDEPDETVQVALENPSNATVGGQGTALVLVRDNEGTPTVFFQAAAFEAGEGQPNATITVSLSAISSQDVTVNYTTGDGTAAAGSDYTTAGGILTIPAGQTTATFTVPILNDALDEENESAALTLSSPANADLGTPAAATLTITDDDDPPGLAFSAATYQVGEAGGSATIAVNLAAASGRVVTVGYGTTDGTAAAGSDYSAAAGTLTFAPGETSKTFAVPVADDDLDETDETVALALASPTNAVLGTPAQATLSIVNNNGAPAVSFTAATFSVSEAGGAGTVTALLSKPSGRSVTVAYATSDGTAAGTADYTPASGTLTFAPGETTKSFSVPVGNDALDEADETVAVKLTSPVNATLGSPPEALLFIRDDDEMPAVSFATAAYAVDEDGATATIGVSLSTASGRGVSVSYASTDGTATSGSDYTAPAGMLTFAPGETSKTFTVSILDDALTEGDEAAALALSAPENATLGPVGTATLTIRDVEDDRLALQSVSPATAENFGSPELEIRGRRLLQGATVWLALAGEENVAGTSIQITRSRAAETYTTLKARFQVSGIKAGEWDVVVRNPDGEETRLKEAFTVTRTQPNATRVDPERTPNIRKSDAPYPLAVHGTKLLPGSRVSVSRGGVSIPGTDVTAAADGTRLDFYADLFAREAGPWVVTITHANAPSTTAALRLTEATLEVTQQSPMSVQRYGRWELTTVHVRNVGDARSGGGIVHIDLSEDVGYRLVDPKEKVRDEGTTDENPLAFNTGPLDPGEEEVWHLYTKVEDRHETPHVHRIAPLIVVAIIALVAGGTCYVGSELMDSASWMTIRHIMEQQYFEATGKQMTEDEWKKIKEFMQEKLEQMEEMGDDEAAAIDIVQELTQRLVENAAGAGAGLAIKPAQMMAKRFCAECNRALQKGEVKNEALAKLLKKQKDNRSDRKVVRSYDPNVKTVSAGDGAYVLPGAALDYAVHYENKPDATAAAQEVTITDTLDTDLDLSTFAFGECGWGSRVLPAPQNPLVLSHDVDLRPGQNMVVQIRGSLDTTTRVVTWTFKGIDPATSDLAWPGFLPPNQNPPEGEGFGTYRVKAKADLASRTEIRNKASIVFDVNAPIITNEVLNTIDANPPTSRVQALSDEQPGSAFTVSWTGQDDASGARRYDVYVAEDDGDYHLWLVGTESTSAQYAGRYGRRYRFYSRATDGAGNEEGAKSAADAETRVGTVPAIPAGVRMVSFPLMPDQADPRDVFGFEGDKWARWDPAAGAYVMRSSDAQGYTGFGTANAVPGRAYWALFSQDVRPSVTGQTVDFTDSYNIALKKGWNMIGVPYLAPVSWDTSAILVQDARGNIRRLAEASAVVEPFAWGWNGETRRYFLVCDATLLPGVVGRIEPWQGYWVLAYEDATLVLPPPGRSRAGAPTRRRAAGDDWSAVLQVRGQGGTVEVTVGEARGRGLALPQPPRPPVGDSGLQAAVLRGGVPLAVDVRADAPTQEWEILVTPGAGRAAAEGEELTLTWPSLGSVPKSVRLTLVDEASGTRRYLRTTGGYTFRANGETRRFRVVAEPSTGPAVAITGLEMDASRAGSRVVRFQLSTSALVDLALRTPTGRTAASLARGRACDPGWNQIACPGTLAPGIYILEAAASTAEGAAAQAVRPVVVPR